MRGHRRSVLFRCGAQLRQVEQLDGSLARVNLGMPRLLPRGAEPQPSSLLTAPWLVHTGEPHAVNFENELAIAEPPYHNRFLELGREICAAYRNGGINWNLVAAVNGTLHIRTFERGVRRMTRSCGTGSAAAFVIALLNGHIERRQTLVKSAGGTHVLAMHDGEVLLAGRPQVQRHLRLDELLYSAASVSAHES
jgi:diaminopimelate epimerase